MAASTNGVVETNSSANVDRQNSPLPSTELVHHAAAGSRRELWRVAAPLMISSGSLSLMYVIDRIFLTWYSTDSMAAALPATMLHWTIISIAYGVATYVNTFVAQYHGAGRFDRVGAAVWQGVYFALGAGVLIAMLAPLSEPIFALIGHDAVVQQLESSYFWILCAGSAPVLMGAAISCYFSGRGKTLTIMWANVGAAVVNIVLDYMMIFGVWPFGAWGIAGAAIATVTAQTAMVVFYAWMIYRSPEAREYGLKAGWRFDPTLFRRLLWFGLPNGLQVFVDVVCFSLFVLLIGTLGKTELAATNLAFNLNALSFVPLMGLGTAVMTITGQRIGEGRPELAVKTVWTALQWALAFEGIFCLIYWFAPDLILLPYSVRTDPREFAALHSITVTLLRFAAVYACFDGMVIVFSAAVRGAGDTRFAVLLSGLGGLLIMVLPTYVLQRMGWGGLYESWALATAFVVVMGLGFLWRFQQGKWQHMRVIESSVID